MADNALFDIFFKNILNTNVFWTEREIIESLRPGGPSAMESRIIGEQFEMWFRQIIGKNYEIWLSKYNIGRVLNSDTYIKGPFIELSVTMKLRGAMVYSQIDKVHLREWQFNLTTVPYVESKVQFEKNLNGETIDFYFSVEYIKELCPSFPALEALVNDYYGGRANNFMENYPRCTPEIQAMVMDILNYIFNKIAGRFDDDVLAAKVKALLVAILCLREGMSYIKMKAELQQKIKEAALLLQTTFNENIDLRGFAKEMKVSPWHFAKLFKEQFHLAPQSYWLDAKMKQAMTLLEGQDPYLGHIKDIAILLGFTDISTFTRQFVNYYGFSPSKVKRSLY